jgi:hypothetical protein
MACWQIKGLLLLASALVATGLAASTAGAGSAPSAEIVPHWCSSETPARPTGWCEDGFQSVMVLSW